MTWEVVAVESPAVIPEGNGKHRSEKRSWKFWRRPRHDRGTPVVELLPQESRDYLQFTGTISIAPNFEADRGGLLLIEVPE